VCTHTAGAREGRTIRHPWPAAISSSESGRRRQPNNRRCAAGSPHNAYDEARVLRFGEDIWEEHSHWLADPATGALHGRIDYPMRDVEAVLLLGDGTWVTTERDILYRWSAPDGER